MPTVINAHRAREIRNSTFGREVREPIAKSCEMIRDNRVERVDEIDEFHKERVISATTSSLPSEIEWENFNLLTLTRDNGE